MRHLLQILANMVPFILGIVIGTIFINTVDTWSVSLQQIVKWLAILVASFLGIAVITWLGYKTFFVKTQQSIPILLDKLLTEFQQSPEKLADVNYRRAQLYPPIFNAAKAFFYWFAFSGSIAVAFALVTNLSLLATLAVQYLQTDRLTAQNELLQKQNTLLLDQTTVMKKQTHAALIEQEQSLRTRLTHLLKVEEALKRMTHAVEQLDSAKIENPFSKKIVNIQDYHSNGCSVTSKPDLCKKTSFYKILTTLSAHQGGSYPVHEFHESFLITALYLQQKNNAFQNAIREIYPLKKNGTFDELSWERHWIEESTTACRFDAAMSRQVLVQLLTLRVLEKNAHFVASSKFEPNYPKFIAQLPQIEQNTRNGFLSFRLGVDELIQTSQQKSKKIMEVSTEDVNVTLSETYQSTIHLLDQLAVQCASEIKRVEHVLTQIDASSSSIMAPDPS